jgi:hypothetical protein
MRWIVVTALVVAWSVPSGAGVVVLKNGKRLRADLVGHLMVSTGSDLLEVGSAEVVEVTPDAVRLSDGRTIRGTLVGGQLRTRTEFGQLVVPLDELDVFRAAEPAAPPPAAPAPPAPPVAARPAPPVASAPAPPVAAPPTPPVATPPAPPVASAPAPAPRTGPTQVTQGTRDIGRGVEQTAKGIGETVAEGAVRVGDGFKTFGLAIWDGMKEVGRAVERVFE